VRPNLPSRYKGVDIKDFTKSWRDGLAFNALIHKYRPQWFDFNKLLNDCNSAEKNLEHAFKLAQTKLNIERLLDVEGAPPTTNSHVLIFNGDLLNFLIILIFQDVITDYPDKKSIMMYVMCYFQVLSQPKVVIEDAVQTTPSKIEENDVSPIRGFFNFPQAHRK
jgi:hypothetical protein